MPSKTSLRETHRQKREQIAAELRETDEHGLPRWTYQEIGDRHNISRERVRQQAKRFGLCRRDREDSPKAEGGQK